jgi:hypothetical protein
VNEPERFTGSSKLTADDQQVYVEKFGERYLRVQQMPQMASRKVRRRRRFRPRSER